MSFFPISLFRFVSGFSCREGLCGVRRGLVALGVAAFCPVASYAATFDCVMEPSLTVKLGSPVASILSRVLVERGDRVARGQLVAQIESSVEEAVVAANEERARSTAEIEAKQTILKQKTGIM